MNKQRWIVIGLAALTILGSASGWIYNAVKPDPNPNTISTTELDNLQISFLKQYGTSATVSQIIIPKEYEVAWKGADGSQNVSVNIGGVWCQIASIPASTAVTPPVTTTP